MCTFNFLLVPQVFQKDLLSNDADCYGSSPPAEACACTAALSLGVADVRAKALYRRATALEQKGDYEGAKADLKRAEKLAPDDKMVPKLMARVEAQIKRQLAKEMTQARKTSQ